MKQASAGSGGGSGLPLNHYDAFRAVALVGDDHGQAGRPYEEQAKVSHGLYVQRHAAFNFDPHPCRCSRRGIFADR